MDFGISTFTDNALQFAVSLLGHWLDFLKGSLDFDDLVFYERSAVEQKFCPVMSFPSLTDLPSVPVQNQLIDQVKSAGTVQTFQPPTVSALLEVFMLPWKDRASVAMIPLFQRENPRDPFPGFVLLTRLLDAHAFSTEMQLLLMSVSQSLADALSRHRRR